MGKMKEQENQGNFYAVKYFENAYLTIMKVFIWLI